jgi:hypothetical protein
MTEFLHFKNFFIELLRFKKQEMQFNLRTVRFLFFIGFLFCKSPLSAQQNVAVLHSEQEQEKFKMMYAQSFQEHPKFDNNLQEALDVWYKEKKYGFKMIFKLNTVLYPIVNTKFSSSERLFYLNYILSDKYRMVYYPEEALMQYRNQLLTISK